MTRTSANSVSLLASTASWILLAGSLVFHSLANGAEPPKMYVDKGACPFECCTYREWTVTKDTDLFDAVDGKKKVGVAKKGSKVTGVTGEVHTVPLKMKDKEGNEFFLLTYQGEGFWKIWKDGSVKPDVEQDWKEDKRPNSTWWVQIKLKDGTTGWTKEAGNFGNMDSCG